MKNNKKTVYPKDDVVDKQKETIQQLKSHVRRLQKEIKALKHENSTLLDAWAKTEAFLAEYTEGVPLEDILKYKTLPKKATRKRVKETPQNTKEATRQKFKKWRQEKIDEKDDGQDH